MRILLKDRFFWYAVILAAFTFIFAYTPEVITLSGIAPRENLELSYYVALYRFLFFVSVTIAAWRFGIKGGLATCSILGLIILPLFIEKIQQPNTWIDIGVFSAGILFSWLIGRQGEIKRLLEKSTEELQYQAVKLNQEITERKRAEEEIRQSEKRYRLLAENATDVIWTVDVNSPTQLTYISPSVTRLLDYSVKEAMDKNMEEVFTPVSHKLAMKLFTEELTAYNTEQKQISKSQTIEIELYRKDGSIIPVETICSLILDPDGKPGNFLVIARDISKRKQIEKRIIHAAEEWRTTFDSITDLISIHDQDNKIVRVNKTFADTFNIKPVDLIGRYCYEVVHGTKEPCQNCPHRQTLETQKPASAEFFESNLGLYLQISTSPMFNNLGEVIGSVHVTRDITQHKQIEEQLIMTDRLASIGELTSGITHELNNPLTSIIGFSELLMEESPPDDIKKDLDIINNEAKRASDIIKNLLTFARKHTPVKQVSQISKIIDDVLKLRAYEQKINNIKINTHFVSDLPEIMVDYFQIQQVFLNIIINAESAMIEAHNHGTLTINTERIDNFIVISFTDDGPGIDKKNIDRIYDPFFTTKDVGKGTGLGLSICHGIVTGHNGKIYVKSKLGKGTTFIIELPVNG